MDGKNESLRNDILQKGSAGRQLGKGEEDKRSLMAVRSLLRSAEVVEVFFSCYEFLVLCFSFDTFDISRTKKSESGM